MTCHIWPEGQPEIELPKRRLPRRLQASLPCSFAFQLYTRPRDWEFLFVRYRGTPTAFLLQVGPFGLTRSPLGLEDC